MRFAQNMRWQIYHWQTKRIATHFSQVSSRFFFLLCPHTSWCSPCMQRRLSCDAITNSHVQYKQVEAIVWSRWSEKQLTKENEWKKNTHKNDAYLCPFAISMAHSLSPVLNYTRPRLQRMDGTNLNLWQSTVINQNEAYISLGRVRACVYYGATEKLSGYGYTENILSQETAWWRMGPISHSLRIPSFEAHFCSEAYQTNIFPSKREKIMTIITNMEASRYR